MKYLKTPNENGMKWDQREASLSLSIRCHGGKGVCHNHLLVPFRLVREGLPKIARIVDAAGWQFQEGENVEPGTGRRDACLLAYCPGCVVDVGNRGVMAEFVPLKSKVLY